MGGHERSGVRAGIRVGPVFPGEEKRNGKKCWNFLLYKTRVSTYLFELPLAPHPKLDVNATRLAELAKAQLTWIASKRSAFCQSGIAFQNLSNQQAIHSIDSGISG